MTRVVSPPIGERKGGGPLCDFGPSRGMSGGFVQFQVQAYPGAGPDASGQLLHPVLMLPIDSRETSGLGLQRISGWTSIPPDQQNRIIVHVDAGSYYLPFAASFEWAGGVGTWEVDVILEGRQLAATALVLEYWLTIQPPARNTPVITPQNHSQIRLVSGSLGYNGAALAATPYPLPLVGAIVTSSDNTIYQTGGRF
jgi:hypothetical protein